MAADEVRLVVADQVGRVDRFGREAQMGNGYRAGLLRVVDEIALGVELGFLAHDLDGVLVGAHRAVRAQAVEHAAVHAAAGIVAEICVPLQAGVGDVVDDADGEMVFRLVLFQFVEHALDHARRKFLGGQAVASAHHARHGCEFARTGSKGFGKSPSPHPCTAARRRRQVPWCDPERQCCLAVAGMALSNSSAAKGRYRRTFTMPTFSPWAVRCSTVSSAASAPEPIRITTRSASGAPTYSYSWYWRPVSLANLSIAFCTMPGIAS